MDRLRSERWRRPLGVCAVAASAAALWLGIPCAAARADTVVRIDFDVYVPGATGNVDNIQVQLFDAQAPITVANFLQYVANHEYDDSFIHRAVTQFIIQGGGFRFNADSELEDVPSYGPILNEYSPTRSNVRGTIAMAKLEGDPNSATSEWFFNLADNSANLDYQNGGFTVFGQVLGEGMLLADAIGNLPKYNYGGAFSSVPVLGAGNLIFINGVSVVAPPAAFDWRGANAQNLAPSYWGRADNWGPTFGVPDAVGAAVTLGNQGAGSSVVDLQATGRTVGSLTFAGAAGTTIQGAGTLTFHNGQTAAALTVVAGSHTIAAPVSLAGDLNAAVDGTLLTLAGPVGGAGRLTKTGPGTLQLAGGIAADGTPLLDVHGGKAVLTTTNIDRPDLSVATAAGGTFEIGGGTHVLGHISGSGATNVAAGSLTAGSIVQDTLMIGAGASVTIAPGGTFAETATAVPEPGAIALLCIGLAAVSITCLRRRFSAGAAGA